jgi:hypothetical protein
MEISLLHQMNGMPIRSSSDRIEEGGRRFADATVRILLPVGCKRYNLLRGQRPTANPF